MDLMTEQRVIARNGYAYAVLRADATVHADQGVRYRLTRIAAQPSERPVQPRWPESEPAALWLHGPDFPRVGDAAEAIAGELERAGWVALDARMERDTAPQPAELVPDDAAGVVIIVAGGDDWSVAELAWLLSNGVLRRKGLPARLLVTASGLDGLPELRATLANLPASVHALSVT